MSSDIQGPNFVHVEPANYILRSRFITRGRSNWLIRVILPRFHSFFLLGLILSNFHIIFGSVQSPEEEAYEGVCVK